MPLPVPGGKIGVTVIVTGLSLGCFSSSSIFNKTLDKESSLHQSEIQSNGPWSVHGASRLSRVPWSEVESQPFPSNEFARG